ncbi:MAG: hypothetical protein IJR99_09470 [Kiritimatiellae bacterium]|nr:hypothetical protein [Kiritimatiellia bacterium]
MNYYKTILFLALAVSAAFSSEYSFWKMPQLHSKHQDLQQQLMQVVRNGNTEAMEKICRAGVELLPMDATWRYNLACALAYRKDKTEALDTLERAIELGFNNRKEIAQDSDLKQLSGSPRFAQLLDKADESRKSGSHRSATQTMFMGAPATITSSNTVWNYAASCFQSLIQLRPAGPSSIAAYTNHYHGPAQAKIRAWMADETASGNFGDIYLNQDRGHSKLEVTNFPGLTPFFYEKDAQKENLDTQMPRILFPNPVLGNCSMAMTDGPYWRSLPRAMLSNPFLSQLSVQMFLNNQMWFYPAHKDYTAATGDVFPANMTFIMVSQGSSFTDKPFLRAFAAALAAYRPKIKQSLTAQKLLFPTTAALFRYSLRTVKTPEAYYTGAAHPVVFNSKNMDVDKLVELAHNLTLEEVPPLPFVHVIQEQGCTNGVDYFEQQELSEGFCPTPLNVSRIARNVRIRDRKIAIRAEAISLQGKPPIRFRWAVLQGDPKKVRIHPTKEDASEVEITVTEHTAVPKQADRPDVFASTRIDIGCFAQGPGKYASLPAIYSVYYLPNEMRTYREDGQIQSVDYTNPSHAYADPSLTLPKLWKDEYHYTKDGVCTGWTRTFGKKTTEFTYAGHRVLETDRQGRPVKACAVDYLPRKSTSPNLPPILSYADSLQTFTYRYANNEDRIGTWKVDN